MSADDSATGRSRSSTDRSSLVRARVATDAVTTGVVWSAVLVSSGRVDPVTSLAIAAAVSIALVGTITALRGYSHSWGIGRTLEHRTLLRAGLAVGGAVLVGELVADTALGVAPVLIAMTASLLAQQAGRAFVDRHEDALRRRGELTERILVVAAGKDACRTLDLIDDRSRDAGWRVVACAGDCVDEATARGIPHAGPTSGLAAYVARWRVSLVVVAADALSDDAVVGDLVALLRDGVGIHVHAGLCGLDPRGVRAAPVGHDTVLLLEHGRMLGGQRFVKRLLDISIAGLTLVVMSPILLATAIAIKLDDGGPILFRQRRVGRDGATFMMPKLRSMEVDAELRLDELKDRNERDSVLFKIDRDPRVTRVGRVIRALSIDEFPQLVSVLRGQMSLIGPRPALPEEVVQFDRRLALRHDVRPGVTGLWQVEARDDESFDVYRRLDIFYVENWSLLLDFTILVHTIPAVVERGVRSLRRSRSRSTERATAVLGQARLDAAAITDRSGMPNERLVS